MISATLPLRPSLQIDRGHRTQRRSACRARGQLQRHRIASRSRRSPRSNSGCPDTFIYAQGSPYVEGVPVPVPSTVFSSAGNGIGQRGLKAEYFDGAGFTGTPVLSRIDQRHRLRLERRIARPRSLRQEPSPCAGPASFTRSRSRHHQLRLLHGPLQHLRGWRNRQRLARRKTGL